MATGDEISMQILQTKSDELKIVKNKVSAGTFACHPGLPCKMSELHHWLFRKGSLRRSSLVEKWRTC